MSSASQSGSDTAVPEVDQTTPGPHDDPGPAPGRVQLAIAEAGPQDGDQSGDKTAVVQEALLDLKDFEAEPDGDGTEAPGVPLPSETWDTAPGLVLPDALSLDAGQLTLETGAGAAPQSGGIGEYREPFAGGSGASLRNGALLPDQAGHPSVPGLPGAAVGRGGAPSGGLGPSLEAPGGGLGPSLEAPVTYNVILGTPDGDRLYGTDKADHIIGLPGNDRLYGGDKADWLQGDDGHDRIYGEAGADKIEGEDGNDRLYGQSGNDHISGGLGVDYLYGGDGADVLDGGDGSDRLYGQSGHDNISGGDGNDILVGGDGHDRLEGGAGHDRIYGNAGADRLLGGEGNDRLYIDFSDTFIDGGAGTDRVYVQTGTGVSLDLDASNVEYAYGHNGDDVFDASGLTTATRLDGRGGDDTLLGGSGNDRLYGRAGDDTMAGGDGRDYLYGGTGADQLDGGLGDDRL
ncbi:MAG: calcium-binding protein, partial [Kiloniellales bacterium]|nr:calcium-binding protein [Kiloniellales bacterium]